MQNICSLDEPYPIDVNQLAAKHLNILLIDDQPERAEAVRAALSDSRYQVAHLLTSNVALLDEVKLRQPDVIVMDIESPTRDMFESLMTLHDALPTPVVMFSDHQDDELVTQSIQAGVSAYVTGNVDYSRVKSILDVAIARFEQFQQLRTELEQTKNQLESRKTIDAAKRTIMKVKGLTEEQAFKAMRKTAMESGQKLEDVAKTMLSLFSQLP